MAPQRPTKPSEGYRTGYLKLRSVLHDRATGLPAFPVHFDRLRTELDGRRELGVLHLELLHLDVVESLYGWQVFDRVLARAAKVLESAVGRELPPETLLAVDGVAGECLVAFVLQQPGGQEVDGPFLEALATALSEKLRKSLRQRELAGLSPAPDCRVGHARLSLNPFYRFERRVYAALAEAAQRGPRRERRRELGWGEELERIIREESVETVFQPVVELSSGNTLGLEALSRGPRDGLFETPRAMFALSGRLGLADQLDRVCLGRALGAAARAKRKGKLFLNLLPGALEAAGNGRGGLPELVRESSIDPQDIVLELSERSVENDPERFFGAVERVKEQGFAVALDDVGTAFDSRVIVERGRPDYLKLDVSLVRGIDRNLIQQELLGWLVKLAQKVGAQVIAEGIESREEAAVLVRAGTHYGQGHLFAMPGPPSANLPAGRVRKILA